jgi:2-polyprenyl-3-methyl-5-hydroxy-6-metoxy-1,4-benzoquinol methylase
MKNSVAFFDKVSRRSKNPSKLGEVARRTLEHTKEYLAPEQTVLDLGCGPGALTNSLAASVTHIHAIDTSAGMIDVAKAQAAERNIDNVEYVQCNLFDDRLSEGSFDVVLAFNVLHYIGDMPTLMARIHALSKPGGLFLSSTACLGEKWTPLGALVSILGRSGLIPKMRSYRVTELESLIADRGFDIVEAQTLSKLSERFIVAKKI